MAGTSIGAIVGGGYAAGLLDRVEDVALSLGLRGVLRLGQMGFGKGAVVGSDRIAAMLTEHFGDRLIEDLPIPYAAVSADLYSGDMHIHQSGSLVEAMRASSAIPALFPAVPLEDKLLLDGGIVEPVPVSACRALGADQIIAVNLQDDYPGALERVGITREKNPSLFKVGRAAIIAGLRTVSRQSLAASKPDVVIAPRAGHFEPSDFTKAQELISIGVSAALEQADQLKALKRG